VQVAQSPVSSLHSKSAASSAENSKLAAALRLSCAGPLSIVVAGATVSIVHEYAIAAPRFPARSVARTAKLWLPSESPL
jgi:hypothetical protein